MSLIIFESQVDLVNHPLPPVGAFLVGYNALDGVLSQKDSNGVITQIGRGNSSLSETLAIGNTTGTYSINLSTGTTLRSNIGGGEIKLDNGTPGVGIVNISTDSGALGQSYLFMNSSGMTLKSLNKSLIFNINTTLQYDTNNIMTLGANAYSIALGGLKVLEFTTATSSSTSGSRVSAFISSNGSSLSSGVVNTVILGGIGQTATQSNSVYVPDLYVQNGKVVKGTSGNGYLRFTDTNDAYLHGTNSHIGILSSSNTLTSNGISIRDTSTASSSANIDTGVTYISSRNSTNIAGLKNTIIIGGSLIAASHSNTTYLGGTVSINGKYKMPQSDGLPGQIVQTDGLGNLSWGSGEGPSVVITAASFSALSVLAPGVTYRVTGADVPLYGGTEIYVTTNSDGLMSEYAIGKFYNPKYVKNYNGYEIWDAGNTYTIGSTAIWGGKVWTNITGNVGTSTGIFGLDTTNWSVINYNTTNYNISYDTIIYDRENDIILYRNEANSNIVSLSKNVISPFSENPIKSFQWGNLYDNVGLGIGGQEILNSLNDNINFRGSYQTNIKMSGMSSQTNMIFDTQSAQNNITFTNQSYQSNITFIQSTQEVLTLSNGSIQENLIFTNTYQYYVNFLNNSFQSNIYMNDSSQSYFSFDNNSHQINLTMNSCYQNLINLFNYSWNRSNITIVDSEDGLNFMGGSLTTFTSNVKILGTSSVINSTNTVVSDSILVLAASQSGSPILDSGFFITRGTGATQGFIWDESAKEFAVIQTNDTDSVIGNVNISSYSNLRAYGITVSQIRITASASNGYLLTCDPTGLAYWAPAPTPGTPFYISGGITDANANKTSSIYRTGALLIGTASVDSNDRFVVSTNTGKLNLIVDNMGSVYNDTTTNTRFGRYSLINNTGTNSTSFGYNTLSGTGSGSNNTAFGYNVLSNNTSGSFNLGLGINTLKSNLSGDYNTGIGFEVLQLNISGSYNTAFGYRALKNNTGLSNTAFGIDVLRDNTSGTGNLAIGLGSLQTNTTGGFNTAIGNGPLSIGMASHNIAIGSFALRSSGGGYSVSIGNNSLYNITSGTQNVAFGYQAGLSQSNNSAFTISSRSIFIGGDTKPLTDNTTNEIVIGDSAIGQGTNTVTLGNDSIIKTVLKGKIGVGTSSTTNASITVSGGSNFVLPTLGNCNGDIVFFGTGTGLTAGNVYYFSSTASWVPADADATVAASSLITIALGTSVSSGMLVKGYANFNTSHYATMSVSSKQYLSANAGEFSGTPPSSAGQASRLIGYCISTNVIYFCPDNSWIDIL